MIRTTSTTPSVEAPADPRAEWACFLSGLVHELKTPLTSLGMISQLLAQAAEGADPLGENEQRYVRNLGSLTLEIQTLVNDAGALARLWSGARVIAARPVALSDLLASVEDAARSRGWERGISLITLSVPDLPSAVTTDRDVLEDALGCLLETAIVLAREHVSLRVSTAGSQLAFAIAADGGCGSRASAEALFDPFTGASARALHQKGGRSLAPLLSRELARALGGEVTLVSEGERTSCVLRVPLSG